MITGARVPRLISLAGLLLAAVAGCGGGDATTVPDGTIFFGPLDGTPVHFILSGTVRYEDRLYGETGPESYGFTGATRWNPVRYAIVEVVNEAGVILRSTRTDANGRYRASATAADLVRLRVLARTDRATGRQVEVRSAGGELYAVTRHFVPRAGELTLDADIPIAAAAGAYNILDLYTAAAEFIRARTGAYPSRLLKAYWSVGSADGTYFSADAVHVLGGSGPGTGDTDEYDDDVLLHEFGHFVESLTGNLDSIGGFHYLNDNTQDMRLAWSEGFASYLSGSIKQWLRESRSAVLSDLSTTMENPRLGPLYLDTVGTSEGLHWFFDLDYATEPSRDLGSSFATAETSVAKVLWNVTRQFGFGSLWEAYRVFPPKDHRRRPVSIETYWDNWRSIFPAELPLNAFRERRVDYRVDQFEDDDAGPRAVRLTLSQEPTLSDAHTLYAEHASDADYFRIHLGAGATYVAETFGLLNGADTRLSIHALGDPDRPLSRCGPTGSARCENDNASLNDYGSPRPDQDGSHRLMLNDGCKLASRLAFTPSVSAPYLLRVSAARAPSPGAGSYGSYFLKISPQPTQPRCR